MAGGDRGPTKRSAMDIKRLASLIQRGAGRLLVIDSRTFSDYNAWHVQGAINVCCSKLVKRRLQQDKVSVTELLQPNGKVKVELGRKQEVVVYDQSSKEAGQLSKDGFMHILMGKLESTFYKVSLLTGRVIATLEWYNTKCVMAIRCREASGVSVLIGHAEVRKCTFLLCAPTVLLQSCSSLASPPRLTSSPLQRTQLRQINDFIEKEPVVPLRGELTLLWERGHIILNDLAIPRHSLPLPLSHLSVFPISSSCFSASLVFHAVENRALFLVPDSCGRHIWRQWPRCSHPCP
uniref:Rhodanese domain-containing protein n=1 Tax=Knipowitschia caucasica TaxID=637954 RepID=A0AAV2L3F5_KNICA